MNKSPLSLRVIAILQLISCFSVFIWILFDPFMGEHFRLKEELLLIQNIRGDEALIAKVSGDQGEILKRNQARFNALSPSARISIDDKAHLIEWKMGASTLSKLGQGFKRVFFETPVVLLLWIFLSTLFAIAILKEKESITSYSWAAPLMLAAYGYGVWLTATPVISPYPTEAEIVSNHLKRPLGLSLESQAKDLKIGWEIYLIEKWTNSSPSKEPQIYRSQIEAGEHAFNLHLLSRKENAPKESSSILLIAIGFMQGIALYAISRRQIRSIKPQAQD